MDKRESLRGRLRRETAERHERLDRIVSGFDLATAPGRLNFISLQAAGMGAILQAGVSGATRDVVRDLHDRARADLGHMNGHPGQGSEGAGDPETSPGDAGHGANLRLPGAPSPLAAQYVVGGSRLGGTLLKRRWLAATPDSLRHENGYFAAPDYLDLWREFCKLAETIPGDSPGNDAIVADASAIFDVFTSCALQLLQGNDPTDA